MNSGEESEAGLEPEEITQFHRDGFVGPFRLCPEEDLQSVRNHIATTIATEPADRPFENFIDRHKDCELIHNIVSHPNIVGRMSDLYGPNLMCRSSRIWPKSPGESVVPWHQDGIDYTLHPTTTVSAWVALSEATTENGCIRLLPGSHRKGYTPHGEVEETEKTLFSKKIDSEEIPEEDIVEMELEPGEFFLFTEKTYHSSTSNSTDSTRVGLSIRTSPSFVQLNPDDPQSPRSGMIVCGENRNTTNPIASAPSGCEH